jgi:uncharacterized protein (DUF2236 family)
MLSPVAAPAFPPDSVIRRVNEEPAILFGAGRALLLQLAHPHVAAGVDEHSDFQHNPFKRLQGTLEAVYTMVFGPAELAEGVGRRIRRLHDFVTGPAYRANDPANLLWVHATLLDSALSCYERLVAPLTGDDREVYYQEMTVVAERFGCPRAAQPPNFAAFAAYWDEQVRSIEVSDTGRTLARDIVSPRLPWKLHVPLAPALGLQRLVAVGSLPAPLREQFGFAWDDRRQRRLDRIDAAVRRTNRVVPRAVRVTPVHLHGRFLLHQARKHVRAFDARQASEALG